MSFKLFLNSSLVALQSLCALAPVYGHDSPSPIDSSETHLHAPHFHNRTEAIHYLNNDAPYGPQKAAWEFTLNNFLANAQDLQVIWAPLANLIAQQTADMLYTDLKNKVEDDRAALIKARDCHTALKDRDPEWPFALGSSFNKLLGTPSASGFLDDILTQFNATISQGKVFSGDIADLNPQMPNEIVQFKFLGLYLRTLLEGQSLADLKFAAPLTGLYPFYYNNSECSAPLATTTLYGKASQSAPTLSEQTPALQMPNMGYVFGGNLLSYFPAHDRETLPSTEHRLFYMGDCSSLISTLFNLPTRVATLHMCWAARGEEKNDPAVKTILSHFTPVEDPQGMMPGDVVVWCPGHTGLFLGWADESHKNIWIIDLNRSDTKDMEGLDVRQRVLHAEGKKTKVLRSQVQTDGYLSAVHLSEGTDINTCIKMSTQGKVDYPCVLPTYGTANALPVPVEVPAHAGNDEL